MMKNQTHFRDGAVVLYKRERSSNWQARIKIGNGKNSWKRIATGFSDIKDASDVACDKYDELSIRCQLLCPVRDNYLVRFSSLTFLIVTSSVLAANYVIIRQF